MVLSESIGLRIQSDSDFRTKMMTQNTDFDPSYVFHTIISILFDCPLDWMKVTRKIEVYGKSGVNF